MRVRLSNQYERAESLEWERDLFFGASTSRVGRFLASNRVGAWNPLRFSRFPAEPRRNAPRRPGRPSCPLCHKSSGASSWAATGDSPGKTADFALSAVSWTPRPALWTTDSFVRADADATELQGDGAACAKRTRKRGREEAVRGNRGDKKSSPLSLRSFPS